ncbi:hemicentin-1-like [Vespula maculifrons]|uniref:Hemicentin-1-like n=1 Tax=Vespula maculifrons TaxID=7453 RepID=A0ABD2CB19_VESMC
MNDLRDIQETLRARDGNSNGNSNTSRNSSSIENITVAITLEQSSNQIDRFKQLKARTVITGAPEKYVRPGSILQLHCVIKKSTETPSYIFWYHNYRMINYDIEHGVNVSTDLIARESRLEVPHISNRHSGNYTCEASNALPARVSVIVIKGDIPAAMQHSSTISSILHHKAIRLYLCMPVVQRQRYSLNYVDVIINENATPCVQ